MTIEQAIKKAIEGGYGANQLGRVFKCKQGTFIITENIFTDPLFWQSLGKAMGWGRLCAGCKARISDKMSICDADCVSQEIEFEWLYHWHRFIDYLAEGKGAEEFFKELK